MPDRINVEKAFGKLYDIVKRLREPGGCPWDQEQSAYSLRTNLVEEAYECVSAIEEADDENLREEIGDLFLVAAMIARIKEEEGSFNLQDIFAEVCAKLIRRHPHVFGDVKKETAAQVIDQWNHIKENIEGRKVKNSVLERVPRTLPPLERAFFIQSKVSKVGFDWHKVGPVWEKIEEETEELKEAYENSDYREMEREFGDLLFTIVNLGRLMNIDPTLALNSTNQKFINRFQELEKRLKSMGMQPQEADLDHLDSIWNQIKKGK